MNTRTKNACRALGFVGGAAVMLAMLVSWTTPAATGIQGARLRVLIAPTGELEVSPVGAVLEAPDLRPGGPAAQGQVGVRNLTGSMLNLQLRALPRAGGDLADLVTLDVSVGGEPLVHGLLAAFTQWSERSISIGSGDQVRLDLTATVPGQVTDDYQGREQDVQLEFQATAAGR